MRNEAEGDRRGEHKRVIERFRSTGIVSRGTVRGGVAGKESAFANCEKWLQPRVRTNNKSEEILRKFSRRIAASDSEKRRIPFIRNSRGTSSNKFIFRKVYIFRFNCGLLVRSNGRNYYVNPNWYNNRRRRLIKYDCQRLMKVWIRFRLGSRKYLNMFRNIKIELEISVVFSHTKDFKTSSFRIFWNGFSWELFFRYSVSRYNIKHSRESKFKGKFFNTVTTKMIKTVKMTNSWLFRKVSQNLHEPCISGNSCICSKRFSIPRTRISLIKVLHFDRPSAVLVR